MRLGPVCILLGLLAATATLAGCVSCSRPTVSARGIGPATPSQGGDGGYTLDVLVTQGPGGPPLAGAGVVAYWSSGSAPSGQPVVQVGPDRVVVAEPGSDGVVMEPDSSVRLATDATGHARADVPNNRIVGVVAAADGWTEEYVPQLATGDGGTGLIVMPLFRSHVEWDVSDTWSPGGLSSGFVTGGGYLWKPMAITALGNGSSQAGYAHRLAGLGVRVEWSNTPTSFGDLGVGVGPGGSSPTYFHDATSVGTGAQAEQANLTTDTIAQYSLSKASQVFVGPASQDGYAGPFGLSFHVHVAADFDRQAAKDASCGTTGGKNDDHGGVAVPGLGLGASLVSLVALVALRRRV